MTFTVSYWVIPALITAGFWIWSFFKREEFFDLSPFIAIFFTMLSWLIYFIIF